MPRNLATYGDFEITSTCCRVAGGYVPRTIIANHLEGGGELVLPTPSPDPVFVTEHEALAEGIARGKEAIDANIPGLSGL